MGLLQLVRDVRAVFTEEDITAAVHLGEREQYKITNQGPGRANRVVFVPGDDKGNAGSYKAARETGRRRRHLHTLSALCRVYCWAHDASEPRNEELQYEAVWTLHDDTISAIRRSAYGTYQLGSLEWVGVDMDLKLGKEIMFLLKIDVPVLGFDTRQAVAVTPAPTTAAALPSGDEPIDPPPQ